MTISTYAELQTAIGTWLNRTDLAVYAPDFIGNAEAKLNRKLRTYLMEEWTTVTTSTSTRFVAYPASHIEMLEARIEGEPLNIATVEEMPDYDPASPGRPEYIACGDNLQFDRVSDTPYTVDFRHIKRLNLASTSTNWLLTNNQDVYLYGSLAEAEPFLKNDARLSMWKSLFNEALQDVINTMHRNKAKAPLRSEAAFVGRHTFDVITGQ